MTKLQETVAQNIRKFRKAKGWSQETLAFRAKMSPNHIARMERAEPGVGITLASIEKIATALAIEPYLLLMERPERLPDNQVTPLP